jgi:hypothetical protein
MFASDFKRANLYQDRQDRKDVVNVSRFRIMFPYTGSLVTGSMPIVKEEIECLVN